MRFSGRQRKEPPKPLDPGLGVLARAVHDESDAERAPAPSAELCAVGGAIVEALQLEERTGSDLLAVLEREEFRDFCALSKSDVSLPRPSGRWVIALRNGEDRERVIGLAGGGWEVEGLRRLAVLARADGRVTIDDIGFEQGLRLPPKELDSDVAKLGATTAIGSRLTGASALEARGTGLAALGAAYTLGDRAPRWHPDGSDRHDMRFWDGNHWTRFVFDFAAHAPRN